MNVMVMDVEGTDGRERGEDQVRLLFHIFPTSLNLFPRISSANPRCSRWPLQKFSLSIFGNTKSVSTRVQTWAF